MAHTMFRSANFVPDRMIEIPTPIIWQRFINFYGIAGNFSDISVMRVVYNQASGQG
jgi:hypothetical protein